MTEITIAGQTYPCRMTMGAFRRFKQLTGHDVSQIKNELDDIATLLYAATASACHADGVDFPLSVDDFCDRLTIEQTNAFVGTFAATQKKTMPTPTPEPTSTN